MTVSHFSQFVIVDGHGRTLQFDTSNDRPETAGSVFVEIHDENGTLLKALELDRAATRAAVADAFGLVDPLEMALRA